jgi:formyl-CoA transferase
VIEDPHLHETGMLQWIDHPDHGRILVHRSPLVFKREATVPYEPSHKLGADTQAVLQDMCGYDEARIASLRRRGAFDKAE